MSHEAILIVKDGNTVNPRTYESQIVIVASSRTLVAADEPTTLGGELSRFYSGTDRGDLALRLICAVRDPQIARPFEQHLTMVTGMTVDELLMRDGADLRIREAVLAGDELVRSRYVFQLLHRFYQFGLQGLLDRDTHIMCTVALGGGDKHSFQYSAHVLREALMSSPTLRHLLGMPLMLGNSELVVSDAEDTAKYFDFLHEPWWRKLIRFFTGL